MLKLLRFAKPLRIVYAQTSKKMAACASCNACTTHQVKARRSSSGVFSLCRPSHHMVSAPQRRSSRQISVQAWGADVEWKEATISSTASAATGLQLLEVDVGDSIAQGYRSGGQFVQMKVGDSKAAFLAIASPPDASSQGRMEFLIRAVPNSTAELLCNLKAGDTTLVSSVMGKGFPVDRIPAEDFDTVLMFATGSGISPVKALIESGALNLAARKDVRLYYGAADEGSMAYKERIGDWEALGVKVIKVFSSDKQGYVQDVFARDTPVANGVRTAVILCGQKEMCEAVKAAVGAQGVTPESCLLNF